MNFEKFQGAIIKNKLKLIKTILKTVLKVLYSDELPTTNCKKKDTNCNKIKDK